MTLEKITPQFIENLLKKWQRCDFDAKDLVTLSLSPTGSHSLEEHQLHLRDVLFKCVQDNLSESFLVAVTSQTQEKILFELKKLFQQASSDTQNFALIYLRYLHIRKYSLTKISTEVGISSRTLRRYVLKGFEKLSIQMKIEFGKKETSTNLQDHFPTISRDQVIGIDAILVKINNWLFHNAPPHVVSIEGLGGIGKTLIAKFLLQEQCQFSNFDEYAWVSAVQKEFSPFSEATSADNSASTLNDVVARLTYQLGQNHLAGLSTQDKLDGLKKLTDQKRCLIIIDNLETLDEVDKLVPELLKLTGKSKLLFTSRKSLSQYPNVHTVQIPPLSLEDSYTLVDRENKRLGLNLSLSDEIMTALYQVIGGIPLVLKLATAQFGFVPAEEIIRQLQLGKGNAKKMYSYIYRQAWELLDDIGKRLLLAMLDVSPDGDDRQWICKMNNLTDDDFTQGLTQLKRLSLVEFSGTIKIPHYRIHRLTTTFLRTDILQGWDDNKTP